MKRLLKKFKMGYKKSIIILFFMGMTGLSLSNIKTESDSFLIDKEIKNSQFLKIYDEVFEPSCALSGCHTGEFEPNFSNVFSSYNTLVYQAVIKNNVTGSFRYRVLPYQTNESVLYERVTNCCFVDTNDRMPFYDKEGLSKEQIQMIADWINEGAKDIFGNIPDELCAFPNVQSIQLYAKESGGEKLLETPFLNVFGEVAAIQVDETYQEIKVKIVLNENSSTNTICDIEKIALQVSKDRKFTDSEELSLLRDDNPNTYYGQIDLRKVDLNSFLNMRINISSNNLTYVFPSLNTPDRMKGVWTIYKH